MSTTPLVDILSPPPSHPVMVQPVRHIVIVGGGTAGWLTAGVIAAKHRARMGAEFTVTLVESPNTPIIGVGEGTWPTLRSTLARIGVSETEFFRQVRGGVQTGRPIRALDDRRRGRLLLSPADAAAELCAAEPGTALARARGRPQLLRCRMPPGQTCVTMGSRPRPSRPRSSRPSPTIPIISTPANSRPSCRSIAAKSWACVTCSRTCSA